MGKDPKPSPPWRGPEDSMRGSPNPAAAQLASLRQVRCPGSGFGCASRPRRRWKNPVGLTARDYRPSHLCIVPLRMMLGYVKAITNHYNSRVLKNPNTLLSQGLPPLPVGASNHTGILGEDPSAPSQSTMGKGVRGGRDWLATFNAMGHYCGRNQRERNDW